MTKAFSIPLARPAAHLTLSLILTAAAAGAAEPADGARRPRPSFGAGVDVVNLNVSALEAGRGHVTDLQAADFRVFEDGVPQELTLFRHDRVPLSVALLVDCSLSMQPNLPAVKAAALRLVKNLGPDDEAQVVAFNHRFLVAQPFTSDRSLLEAAILELRAEGGTGVYNAVYLTLKDPSLRSRPDELRRRAIVVLSDGEDTTSLVSDDQVLESARKRDVTIYTIGMRRPDSAILAGQSEARSRARFFLTKVAGDTGGESYFPAALSDLDGLYDRIGAELRAQYALGYVSSNPAADGKFRRISIQTTRGDVLLRHRVGYYASAVRRGLASARAAAARASLDR
jgi:Ca-activated chloride channel family protein